VLYFLAEKFAELSTTFET